MKYTKTQLIKAMHKWNLDYLKDPAKYEGDEINPTKDYAKTQVERLLSFHKGKERKIYKDAGTGEIITKEDADKDPDGTYKT